jgi:hypothetical protein
MAYSSQKGSRDFTVGRMRPGPGGNSPAVMTAAQLVNGAMKQSTGKQKKIKGSRAKNNHVSPNHGKQAGAALRRLSKMGHTNAPNF